MGLRFGRNYVWMLLALILAGWGLGRETRAQLKSTDASPQVDSVQSLTPTPLSEARSLDTYVQDANVLRPTAPRSDDPRRYDPALNRGQKLLWGTIGLVVHSVCDSGWEDEPPAKPYPLLDAGERRCVECNRMGERAFDAVLKGAFSSDS